MKGIESSSEAGTELLTHLTWGKFVQNPKGFLLDILGAGNPTVVKGSLSAEKKLHVGLEASLVGEE